MAETMDPSQAEDKGTTGGVGSAVGGGGNWGATILCTFILLVLCAGAILFLAKGAAAALEDESSTGSGGDGGPSGSSGGSGTLSKSKLPGVPKDPAVTSASSPAKTDEHGNPIKQPTDGDVEEIIEYYYEDESSTTTVAAPTTAEPTKKPHLGPTRKPGLLACWAYAAFIPKTFDMPDGLCDVLIIGVECYGYQTEEFRNIADERDYLLDLPAKYPKTKFGLVVCEVNYEDLFPDIDDTDFYTTFRSMKIAYYGIGFPISVWKSPTLGTTDVNAPFVYVKRIRDSVWASAQLVYKVDIDNNNDLEYFVHMCKNTTMPDLILLAAHDFFPRVGIDPPVLLPGNILNRPVQYNYMATYAHTMVDAMTQALRIMREGVQRPIVLLLTMSLTQAAMLYPDVRNPKPGRFSIYEPAKYGLTSWYYYFISPKVLCGEKGNGTLMQNIRYQEDALTWMSYNKTVNVTRSVTFDKTDSLRTKVCHLLTNYTNEPLLANISFGVSELERDMEPCNLKKWKSSPFDRVRMVRALNDFVAKEYWDPSDLHFCLKVQP